MTSQNLFYFQDAYQRRPLLENHDSSSDDDAGGGGANNFGYTRKKSRMPRGGAANVQVGARYFNTQIFATT